MEEEARERTWAEEAEEEGDYKTARGCWLAR